MAPARPLQKHFILAKSMYAVKVERIKGVISTNNASKPLFIWAIWERETVSQSVASGMDYIMARFFVVWWQMKVDAHYIPYPYVFMGIDHSLYQMLQVFCFVYSWLIFFRDHCTFFIAFCFVIWFTLFIETRQTPNQTATATWYNLSQFRHAAWKGRNKLRLDYQDRLCRMKTS